MTEPTPIRCVNLDWLEVHCLEPRDNPHDADYFRDAGFVVEERAYGTRVYKQMFTLLGTDGEPLLEIRRDPASKLPLGIHDPAECHIRLHNRTCYFDDAAAQLARFLNINGYDCIRITRVDICYDFTRFDYGDDPQSFLTRYVKHRYAKINQCNRTTHGIDRWAGCIDNSISWGSPSSDVGTKMYNKTMELFDRTTSAYKKPYILWNWYCAGLIDDPIRCTKLKDGQPVTQQVWRIEFSIRSSVKRWFAIELNGKKGAYQSIRNTLNMYDSREKLITLFASLTMHYFHFKKFEPNKRKDRCEDKLLFNWTGIQHTYKVGKMTQSVGIGSSETKPLISLMNKIKYYQSTHISHDIHHACQVLLDAMQSETLRGQMVHPFTHDELLALQLALSAKTDGAKEDVAVLLTEIKHLLNINDATAIF